MNLEHLAIYPTKASLACAVESTTPLSINQKCQMCSLCETSEKVCLPAEGSPGGLLLVGMYPGTAEIRSGRPNWGVTGQYLRKLIAKYWDGPVVMDHAVKCYPNKKKPTRGMVSSCRPYLAQIVQDSKPTRIIALGATAIEGLTGRSIAVRSARRGYCWLAYSDVPVFFLPHPASAYSNRFLREQFERDFEWAVTVDKHTPEKPADGAVAWCVQTPEEAKYAVDSLRNCPWVAFDVETCGILYNKDFRLLSAAFCGKESEDVWVWDEAACEDVSTFGPVLDLLSDPQVKKVGQNVKYDVDAVYQSTGVNVQNIYGDTR